MDPRTPVLVGVGAVEQRCEDPREAREPIELMIAALEVAADDAGDRSLLAGAERIGVPRGFWGYCDPGRLVAERFGSASAFTILAEIGVLQSTLLIDACNSIARGSTDIALVTGGDAKYRTHRAGLAGIEVSDRPQAGATPGMTWRAKDPLWAAVEWDRGLGMPVGFYALMENALRYRQEMSVDAHRDELARMYARFSSVASHNPHAWNRKGFTADEIREEGDENPMLAFPYAKRHNSSWNVDQAAGLIFCSYERATSLGLPRDGWIYPLSGTESNLMRSVAERAEMSRCPAAAIGGRRALELADRSLEDVAHVDLYSCFPAAVRIIALELGIDLERDLTVTGGMPFAGGPLNNYVLQATVRMVEVLRERAGELGLVSAVSGMLTKQGFNLWSNTPPTNLFRSEDVTEQAAAATEVRELLDSATGVATVASYTVLCARGQTARGIVVVDLAGGERTLGYSEDPAITGQMMRREFCGEKVELHSDGRFSLPD